MVDALGVRMDECPINELTRRILGCALKVHRILGPGLLESVYRTCFAYELLKAGIQFEREVSLPVVYEDVRLECGYRMDFIVEGSVVVEVKAVEQFADVHHARILSYLRLGGYRVGLLLNFHTKLLLKEGVRRVVNGFPE